MNWMRVRFRPIAKDEPGTSRDKSNVEDDQEPEPGPSEEWVEKRSSAPFSESMQRLNEVRWRLVSLGILTIQFSTPPVADS